MLNPENLVGQTIGSYSVTEKVAIGGMASIYKAVHESTGQVVAMKVLLSSLSEDPVYVERFIREAKAATTIKHPNVAAVMESGTVENVHYFVMEYIEGAPLDATLSSRGQLFWQDAVEVGIQVAGALENAHAIGIIHRDIKPDNIIVMADGTAKLTDMGISKSLRADAVGLTAPGIILGTPFYMAPEQAKDSRAVDQRSDIYGLGATLYHMLAGRPPFTGETEQEIVLNLLEKDPIPIANIAPYVPKNVCRVVDRMMAKNPQRRYQSMNEVLVDLRLVRDSQSPIFLEQLSAAPAVTPATRATQKKGAAAAAPAAEMPRAVPPRVTARPAQPAAPGTERRVAQQRGGTTKRQGQQPASTDAAAAPYRATAPTPVYTEMPGQQSRQSGIEVSPWAYRERKRSIIIPIITIIVALAVIIAGFKMLQKFTGKEDEDVRTKKKSYLLRVEFQVSSFRFQVEGGCASPEQETRTRSSNLKLET